MLSTAHQHTQQQAGATPPLLEQAVDLQLVRRIRFELVLLQTDHNLEGLYLVGCILPGHMLQAGQLLAQKHNQADQLPEQEQEVHILAVSRHLHSWDLLELPGSHSSHWLERLDHHMLVGIAGTVHSHLAVCLAEDSLVLLVHSGYMELVLAHSAVGSPVEHTHQVQLPRHMFGHKQEVAGRVAHKMQAVVPGRSHLQPEHLWAPIVPVHCMEA